MIASFKGLQRGEYQKLGFLAATYFILTGVYSIIRPLKVSVFLHLVGKEYYPIGQIIILVLMTPCMFLYSLLVDRFKGYQVICALFALFAFIGTIFAYIFTVPGCGLGNTDPSPYNILGWLFLIVMDLYPTFIFGTFWAFANSINDTSFSKRFYGPITGSAKIAGIIAAGSGYIFLQNGFTENSTISSLVLVASLALLMAVGAILLLVNVVPKRYLCSYEDRLKRKGERKSTGTGILGGIKLLLKTPYIFGIFISYFSLEVITTIFDYQLQLFTALTYKNAIGGMSSFMMLYMILAHVVGFVFSMFGSTAVLRYLDMRHALIITPVVVIILSGVFSYKATLMVILVLMVILRASDYGFNAPIRENLYIPTARDVQFKSKGWIDSFGKFLAKTTGASANMMSITINQAVRPLFCSGITAGLASIWLVVSYFLGKKYSETVKKEEIIGGE
ncbi:MAG: hypothetical protein HOG49_20370 [Candidatus Scalindua sp.]|nr:hypothetical protein [Candidatus Scalindua sp.]